MSEYCVYELEIPLNYRFSVLQKINFHSHWERLYHTFCCVPGLVTSLAAAPVTFCCTLFSCCSEKCSSSEQSCAESPLEMSAGVTCCDLAFTNGQGKQIFINTTGKHIRGVIASTWSPYGFLTEKKIAGKIEEANEKFVSTSSSAKYYFVEKRASKDAFFKEGVHQNIVVFNSCSSAQELAKRCNEKAERQGLIPQHTVM